MHADSGPTWRGRELFDRPDWRLDLTPAHLAALETVPMVEPGDLMQPETFDSARLDLPAIDNLAASIRRGMSRGPGLVLLRGLPVARFGLDRLRTLFWVIANRVGTPIPQTPKGALMFSIHDAQAAKRETAPRSAHYQRSFMTRSSLSFHTDHCDVIAFLCVRQAVSGGENYFVAAPTVHDMIERYRPDLLETLYRPFPHARRVMIDGRIHDLYLQPVFGRAEGLPVVSFLRPLIDAAAAQTPLTVGREEALDFFEAAAEFPELHVAFRQEPGDLLFVNNTVILHARSAFVDHDDPSQARNLLRMWLSVPDSRTLPASFAPTFGDVTGGAVRGGIQPWEGD
ncbi:MAG: TauD/TfdA family dioxygenase [Acidobacteriota bacterium]|nr:TauD/TfdA family dioxygenase [Acidobacteriota bacterium]